jgi:hypothetical protein
VIQVEGSTQVGLNVFEGRLLNNVLLSPINDIILFVLCLISQVDGPADLALQVAEIRVGNHHPAAEYALEGSTLLRFGILIDVSDLDSIKNDLDVFGMNRIPSIWVLNLDLIHLEGLICVGEEKVIARTQGQIIGQLSFLREFDASEARTIKDAAIHARVVT